MVSDDDQWCWRIRSDLKLYTELVEQLRFEQWMGICCPGAGVHERKRVWRPRWMP